MKVFISHKREDAAEAESVARLLRVHDVETYLDILDPVVFNDGKSLTDHIKNSLNSCTDILVVMSSATKYSQWVPFEIGMAAQVDLPTVTYLAERVQLPDYLTYWPCLRELADIGKYVAVRRSTAQEIQRYYQGRYAVASATQKAHETRAFYQNLKNALK